MKKNNIGTLCVHGAYDPANTDPFVIPIVQSTAYKYNDCDHVADLFDLKRADHMYTRISNPTVSVFEGKMALLEGGVAAVATSSGQSASLLAILNLAECGDHIISSSAIYGGTYNLLAVSLKKLGIESSFVEPAAKLEDIISLARPTTKAIFAETLANPEMGILDFKKFSAAAKALDVPLIIDNTLATPYLCRPIEHGANIVIHSTTKYTDGHCTSVGGVIIDGGNFNWNNGKFSGFTDPDPSYHGLRFAETFGPSAFAVKCRGQLLRDLGAVMSPMNAFLSNLGLETLHLRMKKHSENALALAQFLEGHKEVSWVKYPGLKSSPYYDLALKYMPNGTSGVLTFGLCKGMNAGKKLLSSLKLASLIVHVGDVRTMVLHPASTTHRQLSEEDQIKAGILPETIRVSVGIEDTEDIIEDFDKALSSI